jgi:hypothetical protein
MRLSKTDTRRVLICGHCANSVYVESDGYYPACSCGMSPGGYYEDDDDPPPVEYIED